ncbi:MAG: glycosyltransferase, partial [Endomicrobia bacterium]|nr:glycosyltransferase [Endomicrobiia bacterium]
MNIFIDVRLASYSYQGIKTYIDSILPYLLREDSNTYFLCGFRDYITKYSTYKNVKIIPFEAPINSFKEQILGFKLKRKLKKIIDVYFFPYPCIPFCFLNENFVVKLYDVTPFRFFYFYNPLKVFLGFILTLLIIKKANKIIAVSKTTADDIIKYFGTDNKKTVVIYDGIKEENVSFSSFELQQFKKRYSLERFISYVG